MKTALLILALTVPAWAGDEITPSGSMYQNQSMRGQDPNAPEPTKEVEIPTTPKWVQDIIDNPTVLTITTKMTTPSMGKEYPIDGMAVFQKVRGGYLIHPFPVSTDGIETFTSVALLITKDNLPPEVWLSGKPVTYIGHKTYTALDGYEKTVPAFKGELQ